jgi:hypothetical protein
VKNDRVLAKDAREIFEKLGPTYIKMGQMMSVRPDVLPQAALDELSILQALTRLSRILQLLFRHPASKPCSRPHKSFCSYVSD